MVKAGASRHAMDAKKDRLEKQKEKVKAQRKKESAALFFKPMRIVPDHIVEDQKAPPEQKHRHAYEIFGDIEQDELDQDYVMACTEKILNISEIKFLHPTDAAALLVVCQKVIGWYANNYEDVVRMKEDLGDALDNAKEQTENIQQDVIVARESALATMELQEMARQSAAEAAELHKASMRGIASLSPTASRPKAKVDGVKLAPLENASNPSSPDGRPVTSPGQSVRAPKQDADVQASPGGGMRSLDAGDGAEVQRRPLTADATEDRGAEGGAATGTATAVGKSARKSKRPKETKSNAEVRAEMEQAKAEKEVAAADESAVAVEASPTETPAKAPPISTDDPAPDQPSPLKTPAMPTFASTRSLPNASTEGTGRVGADGGQDASAPSGESTDAQEQVRKDLDTLLDRDELGSATLSPGLVAKAPVPVPATAAAAADGEV
mmetsp:Transcript_1494/g.3003  ORF Transcript_1494/g.3003 Transcript_1494/m.3003 type:complete len:439 (-) Transcript_1494:144-1460(-)